jgi:hypothetical protein
VTSPLVDQTITPVVDDLLACLEAAVARLPDPPSIVSLRPGDRIQMLLSRNLDECCAGLAWVRLARIYPSTRFPQEDIDATNCGSLGWAAVLEMGVARCAPRPAPEVLTSADDWGDLTRAIFNDSAAMRRAICCWADLPTQRGRLYVPGQWLPLTVEGGCAGGAQTLVVQVGDCDCENTG